MNCVYVEEASSVTLCDGNCLIEGVPGGYYCLPERTGCNAKAGTATWSDQGWTCKCTWENILGGPECNIMYACKNNMVTDGSNGSNNDTRALQGIYNLIDQLEKRDLIQKRFVLWEEFFVWPVALGSLLWLGGWIWNSLLRRTLP